jgi:hypothetical protein
MSISPPGISSPGGLPRASISAVRGPSARAWEGEHQGAGPQHSSTQPRSFSLVLGLATHSTEVCGSSVMESITTP